MNDDTLAGFIADRLKEHQQGAQAATAGPWRVNDLQYAEGIDAADGVSVVAGGRWGGEASVFETTEDAVHIARHDPVHVLAFVAAGLAILAEHAPDEQYPDWCRRCDGMRRHDDRTGVSWPCQTLRAFGAIWSGHPDYRDAWKP